MVEVAVTVSRIAVRIFEACIAMKLKEPPDGFNSGFNFGRSAMTAVLQPGKKTSLGGPPGFEFQPTGNPICGGQRSGRSDQREPGRGTADLSV
jgi:hypothetical protein